MATVRVFCFSVEAAILLVIYVFYILSMKYSATAISFLGIQDSSRFAFKGLRKAPPPHPQELEQGISGERINDKDNGRPRKFNASRKTHSGPRGRGSDQVYVALSPVADDVNQSEVNGRSNPGYTPPGASDTQLPMHQPHRTRLLVLASGSKSELLEDDTIELGSSIDRVSGGMEKNDAKNAHSDVRFSYVFCFYDC